MLTAARESSRIRPYSVGLQFNISAHMDIRVPFSQFSVQKQRGGWTPL